MMGGLDREGKVPEEGEGFNPIREGKENLCSTRRPLSSRRSKRRERSLLRARGKKGTLNRERTILLGKRKKITAGEITH